MNGGSFSKLCHCSCNDLVTMQQEVLTLFHELTLLVQKLHSCARATCLARQILLRLLLSTTCPARHLVSLACHIACHFALAAFLATCHLARRDGNRAWGRSR